MGCTILATSSCPSSARCCCSRRAICRSYTTSTSGLGAASSFSLSWRTSSYCECGVQGIAGWEGEGRQGVAAGKGEERQGALDGTPTSYSRHAHLQALQAGVRARLRCLAVRADGLGREL